MPKICQQTVLKPGRIFQSTGEKNLKYKYAWAPCQIYAIKGYLSILIQSAENWISGQNFGTCVLVTKQNISVAALIHLCDEGLSANIFSNLKGIEETIMWKFSYLSVFCYLDLLGLLRAKQSLKTMWMRGLSIQYKSNRMWPLNKNVNLPNTWRTNPPKSGNLRLLKEKICYSKLKKHHTMEINLSRWPGDSVKIAILRLGQKDCAVCPPVHLNGSSMFLMPSRM